MKKIGIIDYGAGNIKSVSNMLNYLNIESEFISDHRSLKNYDKVILPGVGKFDSAIKNLHKNGFKEELSNFTQNNNKLLLGICLGSQLLLNTSEEGIENGLGLISGKSKEFMSAREFPVPHMGWNTLKQTQSHDIFKDISDLDRFYFAHSYYLGVENENILSETNYGISFPSAIFSDNIFGIQFHPEKSLKSGMKIFTNFYKL
ncbi:MULTISPECIES: imidazole glycerol phosphate synthase subunit HisH [Flavobacteriaceae]|uniref:imidazole glycerol phosphate synthase subunit HisH n=1 Tax=Flavobacteriaceae TaxID=49546 RepID=UPI003904C186